MQTSSPMTMAGDTAAPPPAPGGGGPAGLRFEFATAARIAFGAGARREVAPAVVATGAWSALLVTGRDPRRTAAAEIAAALEAAEIPTTVFSVPGEPTIELARAGAAAARAAEADAVIAVGGGSALDAGKAIAALATAEGDVLDHLEVVGRGRPLTRPPLPFFAVPTTAGTGSEVTRNAVLTVNGPIAWTELG